jgi:hypothetical protein
MTMPKERTRALRWVGEFLQECSQRELPDDLARLVEKILEIYPTNETIQSAAENNGKLDFGGWLQPEDHLDAQDIKGWQLRVMENMQRMNTLTSLGQ